MPGVIIFDPEDTNVGFTVGDDQAAGAFLDVATDTLYLTDLTNIIEWEGHPSSNMQYQWRSQRIRMPKPINMGAVLVEAESYASVVFKLYAIVRGSLTLITTVGIPDAEPVRLPGGYVASQFEIEIVSTDRVTSVAVGQSIFDLTAEG